MMVPTYSFATAAKMINEKVKQEAGCDIGRNRLLQIMRDLGVLNSYNEPRQQYMQYFRVVPKQTSIGMVPTSLINGKGIEWMLPRVVEYYR